VAFHIGLVDQINTVAIAELVPQALVWIVAGSDCIQIMALHEADVPHHIFLGNGTAPLVVELMAVHTAEQDPLAVDVHDAVLHLEGPEANIPGNCFHNIALLIQNLDIQLIQIGFFCTPLLNVRKHGLEVYGFCRGGSLCIHGLTCRILQFQRNTACKISDNLGSNKKFAILVIFLQSASDQQVFHMGLGHGIEVHIPENTGEPPEVLVFDPAGAAAFVDFYRQLVFSFHQIIIQLELRRRKSILTVAHEVSVQPQIEGNFHTLEGDGHRLALQLFIQFEESHIAAHRIIFFTDVGRTQELGTVPGILGIDVHHLVIALDLDMTGNLDSVKAAAVKIGSVKILHPEAGILCIRKQPGAVQRLPQGHVTLCPGLGHGFVVEVIGMRCLAVNGENFRICKPG